MRLLSRHRSGLMGAAVALAASCAAVPQSHAADPPTVIVVPTGRGKALMPTVRAAKAVTDQLNDTDPTRARLMYFAPASVRPPDETARESGAQLLKQASESFQGLDFEAVAKQAGEALKLYKQLLKGGGETDGYVNALHLLSAAALFDGDTDTARKHMNDAVLFSERPPSKKIFNPTVQQLHTTVLGQAPGESVGSLKLKVSPAAMIWLNGHLAGEATGIIKRRAGLYLVRLYRPGYESKQRWMRFRTDEERDLTVTLAEAANTEAPTIAQLRRAAAAPTPPRTVRRVLRQTRAKELVIVAAGKPCTAKSCPLTLRWAKGRSWHRQGGALYTGKAKPTARMLLTAQASVGLSATASQLRACTLKSECFRGEDCRGGRCVKVVPITKKWWFWTLIGVAAAGAAAGVAIPLTRPEQPIIEIK